MTPANLTSKHTYQTTSNTAPTMTTPKTDNPSENATTKTALRSHAWLQEQLEYIWQTHFSDVERLNTVTIEWGRNNRARLGSITAKSGPVDNPTRSEIRINSLLRRATVPESVILQTIAHELAHYSHGFCSPHPQKFRHPHKGNVIEKELVKRGLEQVYNEAEAWLKTHWRGHLIDTVGIKPRRVYAKPTGIPRLTFKKFKSIFEPKRTKRADK